MRGRTNAKGFSLTELMIALVLGLILLGGAISVFLANQATSRSNAALGEIQHIARITSSLMGYDIRNAGYSGCNNVRVANIVGDAVGQPDWATWEFGGGIEGLVSPVGSIAGVTPDSGNEALRVMYGTGEGWSISAYDGTTISLNETPSISAGDIVIACDENLASIFQASAVSSNELTHTLSGLNCDDNIGFNFNTSWNCGDAPGRSFSNTSMLLAFQSVVWFVAESSDNESINSLYRASLIGDQLISEEVVYGVVAIVFEYFDRTSNSFLSAAQINAANRWNDVIAVRVSLEVDDGVLGDVVVPDEVKTITFVTSLRNRSQ
jgi:type IV pilus assembly protein PilW